MAADNGLEYIALTDHDSVAGIAEALAEAEKHPGLTVIPGVEISTDIAAGDVHILGYFVDWRNPDFVLKLSGMRDSREERGQAIIVKLAELGMPLEWSRVKEIAGDAVIGRPHITQAMLEKGYISSFAEAFEKHIGRDGPAYAERIKLSPAEAVTLIESAGGLAVMAHPFTLPDVEVLIEALIPVGLAGIETYYAGYGDYEIEKLRRLAQKSGLVATGGTDFHGLDQKTEMPIGGQSVPMAAVKGLLGRLNRQR
jgi:predicted metal-dependent phosphoesterase TrpH